MIRIKILFLSLAIILSACASSEDKTTSDDGLGSSRGDQEAVIEGFERANRVFDEGDYKKAASMYDNLLKYNVTNQLDTLILYNAGISYLQTGNCSLASERLREVVRRTNKTSPAMKIRALWKLSDVYTCLGDDTKAIVNLIEVYNQRSRLPPEVGKAEVPARLAGAYARIGNVKQAEVFFRRAERGLAEIQMSVKDNRKQKEAIAKTLFQMGNLQAINIATMPSEDYFVTIQAMQKYLLKAVEYDVPMWSDKALQEINTAYENTWKYVDRMVPSEDNNQRLAEREAQIKRLEVVQLGIQSLKKLFDDHIPDPDESEKVTQLMAKMRSQERRMQNYIATNIVGSTLTAAALEAQAIRKAGRVLNPDPILEELALKRMKKNSEQIKQR